MAADPVEVRSCPGCGARLSRYNPDAYCGSCGRAGPRAASPLPAVRAMAGSTVLKNLQDRSDLHVRRAAGPARRLSPPSEMARSPVPVMSRDRSPDVGIGRVLRDYRHVHGLTQAQLADLLGVDQSYVCKLEKGRRRIRDIDTLRLIAARVGIPPETLGLAPNTAPVLGADTTVAISTSGLVAILGALDRATRLLARLAHAQPAEPEQADHGHLEVAGR
jgi:transcriptional regulator with XRE-family HTH domain